MITIILYIEAFPDKYAKKVDFTANKLQIEREGTKERLKVT